MVISCNTRKNFFQSSNCPPALGMRSQKPNHLHSWWNIWFALCETIISTNLTETKKNSFETISVLYFWVWWYKHKQKIHWLHIYQSLNLRENWESCIRQSFQDIKIKPIERHKTRTVSNIQIALLPVELQQQLLYKCFNKIKQLSFNREHWLGIHLLRKQCCRSLYTFQEHCLNSFEAESFHPQQKQCNRSKNWSKKNKEGCSIKWWSKWTPLTFSPITKIQEKYISGSNHVDGVSRWEHPFA